MLVTWASLALDMQNVDATRLDLNNIFSIYMSANGYVIENTNNFQFTFKISKTIIEHS